MNLYTFVLDYDGGTYIYQIKAGSQKNVAITWAKKLEINSIPGLGPVSKKKIIEQMIDEDNTPTPVQNTRNTWCSVFVVRGKVGIITIVRTIQ